MSRLYKNFFKFSAECLRKIPQICAACTFKICYTKYRKIKSRRCFYEDHILGANHEVTGSCTLLEAAGQRFFIDCGMEQGKDVYENQPIPVAPGEIDWVLTTHAHIDHTGLLPLLVRNGFRGKIYATNPTVELCGIMLRDSAHIQEFEAEWKNRKGQRSGAEPVEPMYTVQDAEAAMKLFRGMAYGKRFELAPGIEARFVDVGHLLGSSSIEIWITEGETTTKLVFSRRYRQPGSAHHQGP